MPTRLELLVRPSSVTSGIQRLGICHSKCEEDVEIVAMGPKVVLLCLGSRDGGDNSCQVELEQR